MRRGKKEGGKKKERDLERGKRKRIEGEGEVFGYVRSLGVNTQNREQHRSITVNS